MIKEHGKFGRSPRWLELQFKVQVLDSLSANSCSEYLNYSGQVYNTDEIRITSDTQMSLERITEIRDALPPPTLNRSSNGLCCLLIDLS